MSRQGIDGTAGYRGEKPSAVAAAGDSKTKPAVVPISHRTLDLTITVLAAQSLPLPDKDEDPKSFRPYVKVELHVEDATAHSHAAVNPDAAADTGPDAHEGEYKAKSKTQRGRDPDFGAAGDALVFRRIPGVVPELAFVRFLVKDNERMQRDDLAAWACVRLDRLRAGYRFVHLMDTRGRETDGLLLVKVEMKLS